MWLRHALKCNIFKGSVWLLAILGLFLFSACSPSDKTEVDRLNTLSYACHYRNVDSTEIYARQALALSANDEDGRAEALNNLAFVSIVRMDYHNCVGSSIRTISVSLLRPEPEIQF